MLFCTVYDDKLWDINPMKAGNNVQGVGKVSRQEVFTGKDKGLLAVQEAFVGKVVAELRDCDNVYYEVCNEPYFGGVTKEWNDHIVATLVDAEKGFPARHLIAQNIANGAAEVGKPNPHVSIFNFHYATPDAVRLNHGLDRVIADDETGFKGRADLPYRTEGWEFLLSGGAIYSNLDYSFTPRHPGGGLRDFKSPGGGGAELRKQLRILKDFLEGFNFVRLRPDAAVIKRQRIRPPEARGSARALAEAGKAYAVYVRGGTRAELDLDLPAGSYRAEWVSTRTGKVEKAEDFRHGGGNRTLASPAYSEDIALRVKRAGR